MSGTITIKGVAEAVSCKEGNDHPKYGMSYQTSIKVKGEWYGAFTKKTADELGLEKGKLVSFTYTENGKYKNFDPKSLAVSTTSTPSAASGSASAPARTGFNEAGVKVGHAINNAVLLAVANKDTSIKAIHGFAVDILTLSVKLDGQYDKIIAVAKKKIAAAAEGNAEGAAASAPDENPAASSPKTATAKKTPAKPAAKKAPEPEPEEQQEEEVPPAVAQFAEPDFDDDIPF